MTLALFLKSSTTMPHLVATNTAAAALLALAGPGATVDDVAAVNAVVTNTVTANVVAENAIAINAVVTNASRPTLPGCTTPSPSVTASTLSQCNNKRLRKWRKCWAIGIHLFWEGAKLVRKSMQVVYFHIDEKGFLLLVVRMYGKVAPAFGCQPIYHRIHHKNSVNSIAPFDNDLRKGGEAHKIEITRCRGMVEAQKDSFKRVYRDDGSYHYPKLTKNRLHEKGKEYFENWEITGSKEMLVDLAQRLEQKYNKTIHIRG